MASSLIASLHQFVERFRSREAVYDWKPRMDPPKFLERELKVVNPAPEFFRPVGSVDEVRQMIRDELRDYFDLETPTYMLLIRCSPGTGKTTLSVETTDYLASIGKRIAYAGPRHDLFQDVIAKSSDPSKWLEWLPRQIGDPVSGDPQTCRHAGQIQTWINRGYLAMDFCQGVCGWDYVKQCPWHLQKAAPYPIMYLQHQHVASGHPLMEHFDVLFGDESPIGAFGWEWRIPSRWVLPPGMDDSEPLKEILYYLAFWCDQRRTKKKKDKNGNETNEEEDAGPVFGPELIEYLGGPEHVIEACELFDMPASEIQAATTIHRAEEAENKPYFHLFRLVPLLLREAQNELARRYRPASHYPPLPGELPEEAVDPDLVSTWPCRIYAGDGHLTMLLRHTPPTSLPNHLVWMDATGRPEIYEAIFGRPVKVIDASPRLFGRIYQVVDRSNGKTSFEDAWETDEGGKRVRTRNGQLKVEQTAKLIREVCKPGKYSRDGYQRPTVIGFKALMEKLGLGDRFGTGYFYAARGTNRHEGSDAIFVIGAPMPNPYSVVQLAKQILFERDDAFNTHWYSKEIAYPFADENGLGRAYPVSGFWDDPLLQHFLETVREDEILQAAHRGRSINHACDIWLFTNVPITSLPPDRLLTMREILDAPEGVNIWKWDERASGLTSNPQIGDTIWTSSLVELGLHPDTARSWIKKLRDAGQGWERSTRPTGKPGRPEEGVVYTGNNKRGQHIN